MELDQHRKLAQTHFDAFIAPLLSAHGEHDDVISKCRFHFINAWLHGVKHEQEDNHDSSSL